MIDHDKLPEELDAQHSSLLHDLGVLYDAGEHASAIAQMRQRLPIPVLTHVADASREEITDTGKTAAAYGSVTRRSAWSRHISTLAAVFVTLLLVSSLLFVLHMAQQTTSGHPAQTRKDATVVVQPTQSYQMTIEVEVPLHMFSTTTGWATGLVYGPGTVRVLRTTDGGTHWRDVTPAKATQSIASEDFVSASDAWVATISNSVISIFYTSDGGQSWQERGTFFDPPVFASSPSIQQIDFINAQDGWVLINQGYEQQIGEFVDLWRTTDGGHSWTMIFGLTRAEALSIQGFHPTPYASFNLGISFMNSTTGWKTGWESGSGYDWLYKTTDGGATWQRQLLPLPLQLQSAWLYLMPPRFFNNSDGILPVGYYPANTNTWGMDFFVTHDGGATWTSTSLLQASMYDSGGVDAANGTIGFLDAKHGWVVASPPNQEPTLYQTSDGGLHWNRVSITGGTTPTNIDYVSSTVAFAQGPTSQPQTLLTTTDGGHTWKLVAYTILP